MIADNAHAKLEEVKSKYGQYSVDVIPDMVNDMAVILISRAANIHIGGKVHKREAIKHQWQQWERH